MRRLAVVVLGLGLAVAAWGDLNMKPGLWEEVATKADGSHQTKQSCYLAKDIQNTEKFERGEAAAENGACTASEYHRDGNTVTYTLTCTAGGQSSVVATYFGDHTAAVITHGSTVMTVTRKRIGDCSKSSFGE
ncbi:MAG TPA: DUF3617 family protein [Stellaceae bacterium]|nr:DUF3617 family protein [Stellaceae bacterium]